MKSISEKIGEAMTSLGSKMFWGEAPKRIGGNVLEDLSIVVVDSYFSSLEAVMPYLVVYFKSAKAIFYQEQSFEDLTDKIVTINPDIFLVGHQSGSFGGGMLIKEMKRQGYGGCIIGFSSDRDARHKLVKSGAVGCVRKEACEYIAERVIAGIARIFETRKSLVDR